MLTTTTPLLATAAAALTAGALGFSTLAGAPAEPTAPADAAPAAVPAPPAEPAAERTIAIDCGGYDADGSVVNPEATRITSAPVDTHGVPEIPAVCGGYTAVGTFVGDD